MALYEQTLKLQSGTGQSSHKKIKETQDIVINHLYQWSKRYQSTTTISVTEQINWYVPARMPICKIWFILIIFFKTLYSVFVISKSDAKDTKTPSSSPFHTHLPGGPRITVGRRWPRVETGDRQSRIGRGEAHALFGGQLVRSLAIISRGVNRQLQKQGQQMDSKRTGTGSTSAATVTQTKKEKRRKRVNFAEEREEESMEDRVSIKTNVKEPNE